MVIKITEITKICSYCQKEFTLHREDFRPETQKSGYWKIRKHCSQSCATKTSITKRDDCNDPWSAEELSLLLKWIGKKPINLIAKQWNNTAKRKGWAFRSHHGIKVKATRLCAKFGCSIKSIEDNWDSRTLCRLLGVQEDKVRNWRRKGLIEYIKLSSNQTAISRKQLKEFALKHPEQLGGIDPKKLRKVLKDGNLVKAILKVTSNAPRIGRPITIIRLDTGDVYRSAKQAAAAIAPILNQNESCAKSNVLRVCYRDTPMKNGMDFYQLDYPVYWCPLDIKEEFNLTAGKMLYEIYLELVELEGYSKRSCLVVAARLAVQITLWYFRRAKKDREAGETLPVKETYLLYWQTRLLEQIKLFSQMDSGVCFKKIVATIIRKVWFVFAAVSDGSYKTRLNAEDFALDFIANQQQLFYRNSFLPNNYNPKNKLEQADLFVFIYGTILNYIQVGSKENGNRNRVGVPFLKAVRYIDKHHLKKSLVYDDAIKHIEVNSDIDAAYEQAIAIIKSKVNAKDLEQIEMYIALKLEQASDIEIADCMGLEEYQIRAIAQKIKSMLTTDDH